MNFQKRILKQSPRTLADPSGFPTNNLLSNYLTNSTKIVAVELSQKNA
jgi:hypothetical protein